MAIYKHSQFLIQNNSTAFDTLTAPASPTPFSGIYRCEGCSVNIVSVQHHIMPPQNHHQHAPAQGAIRWRLIVATIKGKFSSQARDKLTALPDPAA